MTGQPRTGSSEAANMSMAMLVMAMVAMIMLFVGVASLNSMLSTRKSQEKSVGMAAGDSGIEKYRAALQARLADESNGFQLNQRDLTRLINGQGGASVLPNSQTSDRWRMAPVRVAAPYRFTVREENSDNFGYWQVYNVLPPRYYHDPQRGLPATDLIVYIRAWASSKGASQQLTTKPRIFRAEYRPGYFSDYQSVTDGPFFVRDNFGGYVINGPIHSNGYTTNDFLARDAAGQPHTGIWFNQPPRCDSRAKFSTSQGAPIVVPGASCARALSESRRRSRQISLLGVDKTYAHIASRCGTPFARCYSGLQSYDVALGNERVFVNGVALQLPTISDSGSLALLFDGNVSVHGALSMRNGRAGRLTIAARRRTLNSPLPRVTLKGDRGTVVGAFDPAHTSVGIVTQGDIVLDGRSPTTNMPCMSGINIAAISQAGSITIAPEFVTLAAPPVALGGRECRNRTRFFGSFAAHGQFLASINWPDVINGGQTPYVGYTSPLLEYNRDLFLNPPPFYPVATPWAMTKVKDASTECLVQRAGDPLCE